MTEEIADAPETPECSKCLTRKSEFYVVSGAVGKSVGVFVCALDLTSMMRTMFDNGVKSVIVEQISAEDF